MKLPRSLDELTGLRAARWIRESTRGQLDNFGPDAQRAQQDRAIERWRLADTGLVWTVAHSGRTVGDTAQFREMLERAGRDYDVLVVGYVSRFARDLRTAVNARHSLHAAGAAILFADERVLTSDEDAWDHWARETVEAESYSRRLGRTIRSGYEAKFRRLADQAGNPPLGFRRSSTPPHVLELDPASIDRAVAVFRRYAQGNASDADVAAELGLTEERVRKILRNPLYNGWARRHRGAHEERVPTPWRSAPPVSDELWERVQAVRAGKRRGGGPRKPGRDLLAGLLFCACGRRIRADGMMGGGRIRRRRRLHPDPCEAWGDQASYPAETWEEPIAAQLTGIQLDAHTIAKVVTVLEAAGPQPDDTSRARLRRQQRELADDHLEGRVDDDAYIARQAKLREQLAALERTPTDAVAPAEAVRYLRDMAAAWEKAGATDPEARSELVHAVYSRIEVAGPVFRGVTLTPWALARGLALALPRSVPGGVKRPRQDSNLRPAA